MKIKCINNKHSNFTKGKEYKAWYDLCGELWSESDNMRTFHHSSMSNSHGDFEWAIESKPHPHADLMLKYAMIAQYDDKPWESFEVLLDGEWKPSEHEAMYACFEYRLKPQDPKIQVGQIWADKYGKECIIVQYANGIVTIEFVMAGISYCGNYETSVFMGNFKRK